MDAVSKEACDVARRDGPMLLAMGGEQGCRRLSQAFYARVAHSEELKPLFPGKSLRCATEEFAAFLIQFFDGDPAATQYRWWLSLRESHARFRISDRQRQTWLDLMAEATASEIEDPKARDALTRLFEAAAAHIVGMAESTPDNSELSERWQTQLALDRLIELIGQGSDEEAIALAESFSRRPSVFVGILARMMETGREPLIAYATEAIENPGLLTARFNGRTLLHFAAGAAYLPVVQKLLAVGVDPDTLDDGGHSPLYRAAGNRESEAVVRELVRAGATVNRPCGVNRSTPLHQAARFGNVAVAKTLLNAGADPMATDKKALTPLDRAINCRRPEVAKLLGRQT